MDDDREAYEFSHALYLARQMDREAAQMIVEVAKAGARRHKVQQRSVTIGAQLGR